MRRFLGKIWFGRAFCFLYVVAGLILPFVCSIFAFIDVVCFAAMELLYCLGVYFAFVGRMISESRIVLFIISLLTIMNFETMINDTKNPFPFCTMAGLAYLIFSARYICLDNVITNRGKK